MKLRSILFNIGVLAVATVLALVVAEAFAQLWIPQWAPSHADRTFLAYDSLLGWSLRPSRLGTFVHPDFRVPVATNALGLRDREYEIVAPAGVRRALLLGDSFGWGFGVTQQQMLSAQLAARHDGWEIINGAVTGYGTDQEYLYYRHRGRRLRPELVILLFHPNDVYDNNSLVQYWHNKPRARLDGDTLAFDDIPVAPLSRRQRLRIAVLGHTYLLPRLAAGAVALGRWFRLHPPAGMTPRLEEVDYTLTRRLLLDLSAAARGDGALFVLVSIPTSDMRLRAFLRETAVQGGFPYLALDSAFTRDGDNTSFAHDQHWNAKGHHLAAGAVDLFLTGLGVFAPPASK
jgi:hypothetical protein